jgi:hypothetical protein
MCLNSSFRSSLTGHLDNSFKFPRLIEGSVWLKVCQPTTWEIKPSGHCAVGFFEGLLTGSVTMHCFGLLISSMINDQMFSMSSDLRCPPLVF